MRYYAARQREDNKKWDFTVKRDNDIYPVGYCKAYKPLTGEEYWLYGTVAERRTAAEQHNQVHGQYKNKYHEHGHDSREDAIECYRQFQLDHDLGFGSYDDTQHKCLICNTWTDGYADIGGSMFHLCQTHQTKEHVETLFTGSGEIWSS